MANKYGTLQRVDSLQALRVASGTVLQYGLDRVWQTIAEALRMQSELANALIRDFCEPTTMRFERIPSADSMEWEEVAEHGVSQPSKITAGAEQGYPLRRYAKSLQWTMDYLNATDTSEFAAQVEALLAGDGRHIVRSIKRAIFKPTNMTYYDRFVDEAALPVKALANADGAPLPMGPDNTEFDGSTHQHYLASATLTTTALDSLINTVREHTTDGEVVVEIAAANEAAFKALTGFIALSYPNVQQSITVDRATGTLDINRPTLRLIGYYNGIEVWVKPYMIANYCWAYIRGGAQKPLALRVRGTGKDGTGGRPSSIIAGVSSGVAANGIPSGGDIQVVYDNPGFPLLAREWRREYGVAPRVRWVAAVLQFNNAAYQNPTIT